MAKYKYEVEFETDKIIDGCYGCPFYTVDACNYDMDGYPTGAFHACVVNGFDEVFLDNDEESSDSQKIKELERKKPDSCPLKLKES